MEFKIGGKITLEGKQYIVVDIMEFNKHKYLYCITTKGKIKAVIFKVGTIEGKTFMKVEENPLIIYELSRKILEKEDKETLKKIERKKI